MVEIPHWMLFILGAGISALAVLIGMGLFALTQLLADPADRWIWRTLTPKKQSAAPCNEDNNSRR